ncbi:hypothetical protein ACTXMK_05405 [Psychrobacter celer]|uniref:hypothetical protein n=1 Tax=Psychrobacter celer TaxID=306572 RepID=UPI003FD64B39
MRYTHNRNTTFYWSGDIVNQKDGLAVDLSQYAIKSQVRARNGDLIADLALTKNQPQTGHITIQADSKHWQKGDADWDITLTKDGVTVATETVTLKIIDGGTHA